MQFRLKMGTDPTELAPGNGVGDVKLASPVARELCVLVRYEEVLHTTQSRGGVVPVMSVARKRNMRALYPFLKGERAV